MVLLEFGSHSGRRLCSWDHWRRENDCSKNSNHFYKFQIYSLIKLSWVSSFRSICIRYSAHWVWYSISGFIYLFSYLLLWLNVQFSSFPVLKNMKHSFQAVSDLCAAAEADTWLITHHLFFCCNLLALFRSFKINYQWTSLTSTSTWVDAYYKTFVNA